MNELRKPLVLRSAAAACLMVAAMMSALGIVAMSRAARVPEGSALLADPQGVLGASGPYSTTEPTAVVTTTGTAAPTATLTITATASPLPSDTPTATSTPSPTVTPSETVAPSPTLTYTPRPTSTPHPVYLPLSVHDPRCVPTARYSDIVFVLDVSNFMRNEIDGRPAPDWAKDWMRATVERMDMAHSRIGLVHFNVYVEIVQHLTNDRQAMLRAIDEPRDRGSGYTRMDDGLRVARDMLIGPASTPGNSKVIFFISIMQAKGIPWRHIPGCVEERGDECAVIAAANDVKSGPGNITIYDLALSWYGGGEDLKAVASDPGKAYLMPGPAELDRIFNEVQVVKLCPPELYWPRAMP